MSEMLALTKLTKFSGCGAKLGPGLLEKALCGLSQPAYPELLVSFEGCEDAGLYLAAPSLALVQTVDFFPPIVDDSFLFGRIAAANALSDVYAMGGRPVTALALVCFPASSLGLDGLKAMMEGGLDALAEAGCALWADTASRTPSRSSATPSPASSIRLGPGGTTPRARLALMLTKPIGTGLINMALRAGIVSEESDQRIAGIDGPSQSNAPIY